MSRSRSFRRQIFRTCSLQFFLILFAIHLFPCSQVAGQPAQLGRSSLESFSQKASTLPEDSPTDSETNLQLVAVGGELHVYYETDPPTYVAYFHVPIPTDDQVPLWLEVKSSKLIDYRFVETTGNNILVAAHLESAPVVKLNWRAWVMVDDNRFADLPSQVPMSSLAALPDSVLPWLRATDTAQVDATIVQETIASGQFQNTPNLLALADKICSFCYKIPWEFPASFDAFSALNWGSSCTGHAHAATALCRALGIPARTKLVFISGLYDNLDMHWSTEYYVPGYGWVGMEPSVGVNPLPAQDEVVIYSCDPADEFPLFFTKGFEGFWHTSTPQLAVTAPVWFGAHFMDSATYTLGLTEQTDLALDLARSAFSFHTAYQGIILDPGQQTIFAAGCAQHADAMDCLSQGDLTGTIANLESAVASYQAVEVGPSQTNYATDFEGDAAGWTHGGEQDEWELGAPTQVGPPNAHSGLHCWATDLDGMYENSADAWLLSAPIDLTQNISAYLEFWVWNQVSENSPQIIIYDPLWLDITTDGYNFTPLCSKIGGGNDDPEVPVVGGWVQMNLDLTPYAGNTVQIRFRFQSDLYLTQAGSYIDDVRVYGLQAAAGFAVGKSSGDANSFLTEFAVSPNPFNPLTRIRFTLDSAREVKVSVYDLHGRKVVLLADQMFAAGPQNLVWEGKDQAGRAVPSGTYLLQIKAGESSRIEKLVLLR